MIATATESRFDQSFDYVMRHARTSLGAVEPELVERFVGALVRAKRVFAYGTGRSGLVARAFAIRLAHLGYSTFVIGETITAPVHARDLVVLVSGSGETYPVAMTAEIAKTIGARVVVLTSHRKSSVARFGDIVIPLASRTRNDKDRARLAPLGTLFETSAWLLLDGIIVELMRRRRQDEGQMRRRHATLE